MSGRAASWSLRWSVYLGRIGVWAASLETSCMSVEGQHVALLQVSALKQGSQGLLHMNTWAIWFKLPKQCFKPLEFIVGGGHIFSEEGWRGSQVSLLARSTLEYPADYTPGIYHDHSHVTWLQGLCTSLFLLDFKNKNKNKCDLCGVSPRSVFSPQITQSLVTVMTCLFIWIMWCRFIVVTCHPVTSATSLIKMLPHYLHKYNLKHTQKKEREYLTFVQSTDNMWLLMDSQIPEISWIIHIILKPL